MLIYLCATQQAMATCLRDLQAPTPLGLLTAGHVKLPQAVSEVGATVCLAEGRAALGAPITSALAELQLCHTVMVDVGEDAEVNDLRTLRSILQQLDGWEGTLVASPRAVPLLGQLEDDPDYLAPVPETMMVAAMNAAPDIRWLRQPNAPRRLLAFDGDVYVRYDPTERSLVVHGTGSVLAVTLSQHKRSKADEAHANVLTSGMRLTW